MRYVLTIFDVIEMQVSDTLSVKSDSEGNIDEIAVQKLLLDNGFENVDEDDFYRLTHFCSIVSHNTDGTECNLQITRCY
jgi:hypothetical protein